MVNFKKMDEHDFVFVNKPLTATEEKEFSNFLRERKARFKMKSRPRRGKVTQRKKVTA